MLALGSALILAACSKDADSASQPAADMPFPPGVSNDTGAVHTGIYRASGEACCWLAQAAQFATPVRPTTRTLALTLFVPDVAPLVQHGETVSVIVDGKHVRDAQLRPGAVSTISVPVAAQGRSADGLARVELRMSDSYVPNEIGLNKDVRRLSVVLRSVSAD